MKTKLISRFILLFITVAVFFILFQTYSMRNIALTTSKSEAIRISQLVKNGLYGSECVAAAELAKKSRFSEQLKLLQQNQVDEKDLQGGELGGNKDYGDIFGDPNLFKNFGGFDTD